MSGRVVVLGSINLDLVAHVPRHPAPGETLLGTTLERLAGGKGANQAVAAAAAGATVSMVGAVGHDPAGRSYLDRLRARGVDTDNVLSTLEPTGTALIVVDDAGENSIVVVPGANEKVQPATGLAPGDVLLAQLEVPLEAVALSVRAAHESGARVVLNLAPYADLPGNVLRIADPVVVNEHEADQLARSGVEVPSLLVTLGPRGARWGDLELPAQPAAPDEVVDTTGAGDAFCGTLAAALAGGAGREQALRVALAAGGAAVRHAGAQPDPTL